MFAIWKHKTSGDVYAVRIEGGRVTGVRGPFAHSIYNSPDLPKLLQYIDYHTNDAEWMEARREDFALYEPR